MNRPLNMAFRAHVSAHAGGTTMLNLTKKALVSCVVGATVTASFVSLTPKPLQGATDGDAGTPLSTRADLTAITTLMGLTAILRITRHYRQACGSKPTRRTPITMRSTRSKEPAASCLVVVWA